MSHAQHHAPPSQPDAGDAVSARSKVLDAGASMMQRFAPVKSIHEHLCGFHFYAHDMNRQVEAHHYCSHQTEEMWQCVIYDSDQPDAKLIGIEYVISERLFADLPDNEKKLWHSHSYEIKGGSLTLPGLMPEAAELHALKRLAKTYGKTWHTWQVDRGDKIPLGPPQLMSAFTEEGQLDPELLRKRDDRYGICTADKVAARQDIEALAQVDPLADYFKTGNAVQVQLDEQKFKPKQQL